MSMRGFMVAACSFALLGARVFAFQQPSGGQTEFVPISQLPPGDQLPAARLLIAAYAFVWIALMVYLWSIWRRLQKAETDIRALERQASSPGSGAR